MTSWVIFIVIALLSKVLRYNLFTTAYTCFTSTG
jgi:membrane protein YqaA with SNARE-associated domain